MANRCEKMETVTDFVFLGSKITVNGDCSHEIERHLLLGRKAMTNLGSILKSRDITLLTEVCIVKASPTSLSPYWFLHCVVYCPASWCLRSCKKFHALLPTLILPPPIRKQSSSYLGPTWGGVCLGVSMYKIALQYHLGID